VLAFCLVSLLVSGWWEAPGFTIHPLHTTLTEVGYNPTTNEIAVRIRMFADDLAAAIPAEAGTPPDTAMSRYARGTFALVDRWGRPVPLRWQGAEKRGDTVVLRLGAAVAGGLRQAKLLSAVLWERFPDQVNIVRAFYDGRVATLLFTQGDPAKTLP
jgi:hypothetical protein